MTEPFIENTTDNADKLSPLNDKKEQEHEKYDGPKDSVREIICIILYDND